MNAASQKAKILKYCETHGSITNREAFIKLHINSPTKRISELRRMGYQVRTEIEKRKNESGEEVKYNRYFISAAEGA